MLNLILPNSVECEAYMAMAIAEAERAVEEGMRPFGCVIADGHGPYARGRGSETRLDPTRHSECVAIRRAWIFKGGPLTDSVLYSTHEPCTMCCGAIKHAKLGAVVWGSHRSDVPELFRLQAHPAALVLRDTTTPPVIRAGILNRRCVDLFAEERAALRRDAVPESGPRL